MQRKTMKMAKKITTTNIEKEKNSPLNIASALILGNPPENNFPRPILNRNSVNTFFSICCRGCGHRSRGYKSWQVNRIGLPRCWGMGFTPGGPTSLNTLNSNNATDHPAQQE